MEALEYAYNLAAVIEVADQGALRDFAQPLSVLRNAEASGLGTMNIGLRLSVPEDAQLQISFVNAGGSFNIKFGGLGNAIKALAAVFDPIQRAQRREELRHSETMNKLAEDDEAT